VEGVPPPRVYEASRWSFSEPQLVPITAVEDRRALLALADPLTTLFTDASPDGAEARQVGSSPVGCTTLTVCEPFPQRGGHLPDLRGLGRDLRRTRHTGPARCRVSRRFQGSRDGFFSSRQSYRRRRSSDHRLNGEEKRPVSTRKRVVERYIEGFRRGDHAQILSCLADDVVWALHGYKTLQGKEVFDAEIEDEGFEGSPTLTIDRLIEEGDTLACTGGGSVAEKGGTRREFAFCEVFSFTGHAVRRLDTYHVWLT